MTVWNWILPSMASVKFLILFERFNSPKAINIVSN